MISTWLVRFSIGVAEYFSRIADPRNYDAGIGFNYSRLCTPYITERVLWETFGEEEAAFVRDTFLEKKQNSSQYALKPEFDTQRKVETWYNSQVPNGRHEKLRDGLYALIANVILLNPTPVPSPEGRGDIAPGISEKAKKGKTTAAKKGINSSSTSTSIPQNAEGSASPLPVGEGRGVGFHFRFGIEKTSSFQHLPDEVKGPLKNLYVDYFYRRQDDFWQKEALDKLPELRLGTNMLICGEDLGMVPHCVPDVMKELAILSLEIQRMPKQSGLTFFHPKDAPYLSVITPGTHDMSTLRGWWEENRELSQRFFNEMLAYEGTAPYFCEPWLNRAILEQHFRSPAMWSIFQLQDLLGMDGALRRENPHDERINVPANPKHYWRYRAHLAMEDLMKADDFNAEIRRMVAGSGR